MDARRVFMECGSLHEPEPGQYLPYHFISDDRHQAGYFAVGPLQHDVRLVWQTTEVLAGFVSERVDVVISTSIPPNPTFAYLMALHLLKQNPGRSIKPVWAWPHKHKQGYSLEDGVMRLLRDKSVLVLHGVIGDPKATAELVKYVRAMGGEPVAVGAWAMDVSIQPDAFGVPNLYSLYRFSFESWAEGECQESGPCARQVPIVTNYGMGRGHYYRLKNGDSLPGERFIVL